MKNSIKLWFIVVTMLLSTTLLTGCTEDATTAAKNINQQPTADNYTHKELVTNWGQVLN